jgi:hypothetical protein
VKIEIEKEKDILWSRVITKSEERDLSYVIVGWMD